MRKDMLNRLKQLKPVKTRKANKIYKTLKVSKVPKNTFLNPTLRGLKYLKVNYKLSNTKKPINVINTIKPLLSSITVFKANRVLK